MSTPALQLTTLYETDASGRLTTTRGLGRLTTPRSSSVPGHHIRDRRKADCCVERGGVLIRVQYELDRAKPTSRSSAAGSYARFIGRVSSRKRGALKRAP